MKRSTRNLLAMALATQMVFSLTACGSKKKGNEGTEGVAGSGTGTGSGTQSTSGQAAKTGSGSGRIVAETDPYYNVVASDLKADIAKDKEIQYSDISEHFIVGDRILANVFVSYKKPANVQDELDNLNLSDDKQLDKYLQIEAQYEERSLQLFDLNGEAIKKIELEDGSSFIGAFAGKDGEILIVTSKLDPKSCMATPKVSVLSSSGDKLRDIDLQVKDSLQDVRIYVLENGNMLLASIGKFWLLDGNGKVLSEEADPNLNGTVLHSGGKWFALMPTYTADGVDVNVQEVDTETGKLIGKPIKTSDAVFWVRQGDQDCFLLNTNGIEKFDIATQETTKVLDWKDTDVNSSTLQLDGARITSENDMVFFKYNEVDDGGRSSMDLKSKGALLVSVVHLSKADKNPHAGKTVLKLGVSGEISGTFLQKVLDYNLDPQNSTRIEITDYTADAVNVMDQETLEKTLLESTNQLTMDMLSGNGPDILVGYSDLSQFNTDTMLVDLNPLIDADSTVKREEYFDNILRAFEVDGKLYTIPLTYSLEGMVIDTQHSGAKEKWTFAEFDQMASSLPEKIQPLASNGPEDLLKQWMESLSSHFIDTTNKKVDFESEEFRTLLETIKKYGKSSNMQADDMVLPARFSGINDDVAFIQNMVASAYTTISDLEMFASMSREKNGRKPVFSGVPSLSGMGMSARGHLSMAVTSSCADQNLAWQFIRSFLNEDTQYELSFNSDTLPLNRNTFKKNCQEEMEVSKEYIEDLKKNASKMSADELDNVLELTQEHADKLEALISSVDSSISWDNDVMNIILEEAAGFFAGQRSVEDVCKNIQNRATLVVQER